MPCTEATILPGDEPTDPPDEPNDPPDEPNGPGDGNGDGGTPAVAGLLALGGLLLIVTPESLPDMVRKYTGGDE